MNRATGVYVFIAENEAEQPTSFLAGDGPLGPDKEPVSGSELRGESEEGVVGIGLPGVGFSPLFLLDVHNSEHTKKMLDFHRMHARRLCTMTGRSVELVRFGERGREHVEWIRP